MADEKPTTKKAKNTPKKVTPPVEETPPSTAVVTTEPPAAESELTYTTVEELDTDAMNRLTVGELVLSYPARDIVLALDGATAARVIAAFARPERRRYLQDVLNTKTSTMRNLWSSFDLDSLLAVSWYPELPSRSTQRMTVDPPSVTETAEALANTESPPLSPSAVNA